MNKSKENIWKDRAIDRRYENKYLKKRIKELTQSRDNWKEKHKAVKDQKELLEIELKNIKKKLSNILKK